MEQVVAAETRSVRLRASAGSWCRARGAGTRRRPRRQVRGERQGCGSAARVGEAGARAWTALVYCSPRAQHRTKLSGSRVPASNHRAGPRGTIVLLLARLRVRTACSRHPASEGRAPRPWIPRAVHRTRPFSPHGSPQSVPAGHPRWLYHVRKVEAVGDPAAGWGLRPGHAPR